MLCVNQTKTDPYFNIASEEFLLKNFDEDIIMLYINEPSVIVGKHQNTLAEINYKLAKQKEVSIIRRLSGGGAVYHDLGNLNFTFIKNGTPGKLVDFKGYTQPIVDALNEIGVNAEFGGHNSLLVGEKKFSGNAEHIFKNRVMHHGTILFSTNLETLAEVLYVSSTRFNDNAVKSVRAKTTNLNSHLPSDFSISKLKQFLFNRLSESTTNARVYKFTDADTSSIMNLVENKYLTWDWNFGYSPSYTFSRSFSVSDKQANIEVTVEKGRIMGIIIKGNEGNDPSATIIAQALKGVKHNDFEVQQVINKLPISDELKQKLVEYLF
ncbi:MAG: lipoate--protein ligase [Bacteroidales bacterium]